MREEESTESEEIGGDRRLALEGDGVVELDQTFGEQAAQQSGGDNKRAFHY